MNTAQNKTIALNSTTLELRGIKSYSFQILLVGLAVALPYAAHFSAARLSGIFFLCTGR